MSYRLTKEELDAQFEQFLKESVSDDSLDFKTPDKQLGTKPSQKSAPKATVLWWEEDEPGAGRTEQAETTKRRFLKARRPQPEEKEDVSEEPLDKPVPKPRCKALDKPRQSPQAHADTSVDVSSTGGSPSAPCERSDSDSVSSPDQETLQAGSGDSGSPDESQAAPPADSDSHSPGSSRDEPSGSGKSFRKSLRKSESIREEDEDLGGSKDDGLDAAFLTRGSADTDDSALAPAGNVTGVGLDTLEEEEEKTRFFQQLEAGASTTIDYSKLNRELDSTGSTVAGVLGRTAEGTVEQSDNSQSKSMIPGTGRPSTGSPHYSEDFEDEENTKEPPEEKPKVSPILARVSLHDSLDDTGEEERRRDTAGSVDKGQSYVQSGGSEMEALQEAYRQIHVVDASDERVPRDSSQVGDEANSRAASPSSLPHRTQLSLQPVSTNESELPTAEELMKRLQPQDDQIRGFTLQPISPLDLEHKKTPHSLGRTFTEAASSESLTTRSARETPGRASPLQDAPLHELKWSIREEVERLMQDHNKSSHASFHAGKTKKHPASRGSTSSHLSAVKPGTAPVRGRAADKRTSAASRAVALPRSQSSATSRVQQQQQPQPQRAQSSRDKKDAAEAGLRASSELVASVQSLVTVLQQRMEVSSSHQDNAASPTPAASSPTLQIPPMSRDESSSLVAELRAQLALRERELQRMKEGAEELNSLRQQNYLLQTRLRGAEKAGQKQRAQAEDGATEEMLKRMERDIREQETLIKGYQQENEKLYTQMKTQQVQTKANEEAMFNENQRLLAELALTREQLKKMSRPAGSMCRMDHTQRITDLLAQIHTLERNEAKLSADVNDLTVERQALEVEVQLVKKERDLAQLQATSHTGDGGLEIHALQEQHREEVACLKKKLQWFAENQELLDRDADRLKTATAEIHQLKEQVEKLKHEVGRRSSEQQRKSSGVRAVDTKKMQELQRQVKELEHILRSRNPNSLPALIYAAATAGDDGTSPSSGGGVTALLERRIQRLEAELESQEDEAKRSLRAMEQQFQRIKLRYEQEISELQQKLELQQQVEVGATSSDLWVSKAQAAAAEEELQRVTRSHREREKDLHQQIESLQQQLKRKATSSPNRHQRQAEEAIGARIERLSQELSAKTRTVQELNRTVERLQRERRCMLSTSNSRAEARPAGGKRAPSPKRAPSGPPAAGEDRFPEAQYEKTYQPTIFAGSHISEVLQENEALGRQVELQQLQVEQEREARRAKAEHAEAELRRLKALFAEQTASMKAEHLRVLDHLRATHALEHSSSKVAELANKLSSQEVILKHLQEQLQGAQEVREALAVSRKREEALQTQVTRLLQELKEATDAQGPEAKLLCGLERKIVSMELRHRHRELELQQVMGGAWQMAGANQQSEVECWRRLAQEKSREVEAFRVELDAILDVLRHLQRQGTVLPPAELLTQRS